VADSNEASGAVTDRGGWRWLRAFGRWSLRVPLLALILLETAYLLRRPLFERALAGLVARVVGEALGAEVEVGEIGGDWLTTVFVGSVQVAGGDVLRRVADGHLEARVDPLRLLDGDLAGVLSVRLRAATVAVDLPAPEPEPASTPPPPPDLAAWSRLLPGGAEVEVGAFTLRRSGADLAGPVRVLVAPARVGRGRTFAVAAPAAAADGRLDPDGAVVATVRTGELARVVRFFAPETDLAGGHLEADATLRLSPEFGCAARVHVADLVAAARTVARADADVRLADDVLHVDELELATPGARFTARGAVLPLSDPLPTAGDFSVAVSDLTPFATLLPPPVRDQLPIRGHVRAHVLAGAVAVEDGRLDCAAGSVVLHAGAVALRGGALAQPLRFDVRVTDPRRLPLPADLPVHALGATLRGSLERRDARLLVEGRVDVQVADDRSRGLRATGTAAFAVEPLGEASCDLVVSGAALPSAVPTRVRGRATWTDAVLHLDGVRVAQQGADLLELNGTVPLAGGSEAILERGDLALTLHDADVGTVLRGLGVGGLELVVGGRIALAGGEATAALTGAADFSGERLRFAADLLWRQPHLTVTQVRVEDAFSGSAELAGTLGLAADLDWRTALQTAADLRLSFADFAPGRLGGAESGPAAVARISGDVLWRTAGAVDLRAALRAAAVVGEAAEPATAELSLRAGADATTLESLQVHLGPASATGSGEFGWSPLALLAGKGVPAAATVQADLTLAEMTVAALRTWLGLELPFDELEGTCSADAHVRGAVSAPEFDVALHVRDGRLRTTSGERLDDIAAELRLTPRQLEVVQLNATRGKGPLTVTGTATAPGPWWQSWQEAVAALSVTGDNVLLHRGGGVKVRADLALTVAGPLRELAISGRAELRDSKVVTRVPFFDLRRTGGDTTSAGIVLPGVELPPPLHALLDVEVRTAEPVAIKTNVLEGKLDVQLALLGDLAAPRLLGAVSGPDATVILPGVRLHASTLLLQFTAEAPHRPTLTLNARGRRHGYDIQVNARGPYDHPDIVMQSDPVLPPDELVVLVTTGARPQALRSTTGVGTVLGAYLAEEFANWIFGSESTEAKEGFLDRFTVETGTEMSRGGNESIVVEFRVAPHVFLQGERDVYEDINMGVVYRIRFR